MIVPGTWIFPDDAQVQAASERGLIVNQHHAIPLGVNVARWPRDVPYNFSTHPEILERAWTNAVDTYKPGEEILWSVGLRGLSDSSYASLDPSVRNNDPLLGQRVSDAIAEQIKIVRAKYPNAQFVTDLWQEGARLMQKGYLKIPPEVSLVWADTGYGDMQDGGKVAAGQGAYFHVAMMNGQANQLSEMVPVAIIQSELGRYIKAGATSYLLVNTSDLRPVAMTTRALMEVAWGGVPAGFSGRRRRLLPQVGDGGVRREVSGCVGETVQGVFCGSLVARAVRSAAVDFRGQCATAARKLQQDSKGRWRPALSLRDASAHSRQAERRPGGRRARPVAEVDAAHPHAVAHLGDGKRLPCAGHQGLRRSAAALGCGLESRCGSWKAGRSGAARLLPGRSADHDHHQPRKQSRTA